VLEALSPETGPDDGPPPKDDDANADEGAAGLLDGKEPDPKDDGGGADEERGAEAPPRDEDTSDRLEDARDPAALLEPAGPTPDDEPSPSPGPFSVVGQPVNAKPANTTYRTRTGERRPGSMGMVVGLRVPLQI
jgi:hypothetical protein